MLPTVADPNPTFPAPHEGVALNGPIPEDPRDRRRLALTSRECPDGLGPWVERRCMRTPALLPRRHQTDRWRPKSAAPAGLHYETPDGAHTGIPAWRSRRHWLDTVVPAALKLMPEKRARLVSEDLLIRYLRVRSGYAHPDTGRGAIVRPDTIASVLGVGKRQVQNAQKVARDMGLEVVIQTGRMLTWAERMEAWRSGSHQRGLATEVSFTIPEPLRKTPTESEPVDVCTPPRRSKTSSIPRLNSLSPNAAGGETKDAAPPRPRTKEPCRRRAGTHLAGQLVKIVPWLRHEQPGRLGPALARFATASTPWSAQDVALALTDLSRRRGHTTALTEDRILTRPAVVLAGLLRDLDVEADHPTAAAFPAEPPKPCRRPDCDHGWITLRDGRGREVVAKCRTCPPGVRSGHDPGEEPEF